jgi:hypothetical protein
LDTINMADFQPPSPGGQADEGATSSLYIEDYATTNTDKNQREALPSSSTMELDQPRGSSDEHRYDSLNGTSTSYLSAQDQAQAQAQDDMEPQASTSVLSPQSVVIRHSTIPDGHG